MKYLLQKTDASRTSIRNYLLYGIIQTNNNNDNNDEKDYAEDSPQKVNLTRKLTSIGFRLTEVAALLSVASVEEVEEKLSTLTLRELQEWIRGKAQS